MAINLFDRPLFIQRKHYMEEIASLDDAFDLLESWPLDQRGLAHETLLRACREAASGRFPLPALRSNLERFLRKARVLAAIEDVPNFANIAPDRNVSGM
jgi:hypothetical protein